MAGALPRGCPLCARLSIITPDCERRAGASAARRPQLQPSPSPSPRRPLRCASLRSSRRASSLLLDAYVLNLELFLLYSTQNVFLYILHCIVSLHSIVGVYGNGDVCSVYPFSFYECVWHAPGPFLKGGTLRALKIGTARRAVLQIVCVLRHKTHNVPKFSDSRIIFNVL